MQIRKLVSSMLACIMLFTVIPLGVAFGADAAVTSADVPDANLLEALTTIAGTDGALTMAQLSEYNGALDLKGKNIQDITGLRLAKKAVSIDLRENPVTQVPEQGFASMMYLTTVNLPDTVVTIGEAAFSKCYSLENFVMPDSVTSIGAACFLNVEMTNVTLSKKLTAIPDMAFMNCVNLTKLVVPESVTSFGIDAFAYCARLEEVNIPSGIQEIPESSFEGCTSLTYVDFPAGLKAIGKNAFYKCTSLIGAFIPDETLSIGEGAFLNCEKMTGVSIASHTSVGTDAFKNAPLLLSLDMRAVPETLSLSVGETYTFTQEPLYNVQWTSSDTAVLEIQSAGNATAKKAGTVKVTCEGLLNGIPDTNMARTKIEFHVTVSQVHADRNVVMKRDATEAYVDGAVYPTTQYATGYATMQSMNGTYVLPLRYIAEVNGMQVDYLGSGQTKVTNLSTKEYLVVNRDSTVMAKYSANGTKVAEFNSPQPVTVQNTVTFAPMRVVCEALGLGVRYQKTDHGTYVVVSGDQQIDSKPDQVNALIEEAYQLGL